MIPTVAERARVAACGPPRPGAHGASTRRFSEISTRQVLVVEDDPDVRDTLAEVLREAGYQAVVAEDGLEALSILRQEAAGGHRPSLILLDLMMPRMDGWQFRQEQLADPGLASIPVLVVTAVADTGRSVAGLDAVATLRKPVRLACLLAAVAKLSE